MPYGLKYSGAIISLDGSTYAVEILERDYAGASSAITLASQPTVVRWGQPGGDQYQPVLISTAEVRLFDPSDAVQSLLFAADTEKYRLRIKKGANIYWVGKILPYQYDGHLDKKPRATRIAAIDGIGALQSVAYTATGRVSVLSALVDILSMVGLELPIDTAMNWFTPEMSSSVDPLTVIKLDRELFREKNGDPKKTFDVLHEILQRFNLQLYQSAGVWRIIQYELLAGTTYKVFFYDKDGVETGSNAAYNPGVTVSQNDAFGIRRAGGRRDYLEPYKSTLVRFLPHQDYKPLIYNGHFEEFQFSDGFNRPTGWGAGGGLVDWGVFEHPDDPLKHYLFIYAESATPPLGYPTRWVETINTDARVGIGHALRFRLRARIVEVLGSQGFQEDQYIEIKVGSYYLSRSLTDLGGGEYQENAEWVHESVVTDAQRHIIFRGARGGYITRGLSDEWREDVITTPPLTLQDQGGIVRIRIFQKKQNFTPYGSKWVGWDNVTCEVLPAGGVGVGVESKASAAENNLERNAVELTLGDGLSTASRSTLTVLDDFTVTKNWKRGAYTGGNGTAKSIDKMLAETFLRTRKNAPVEVHEAAYIKRATAGIQLEVNNVLVVGSKRFAPIAIERDLQKGTCKGEWIETRTDDTGITLSERTITSDEGGGGSGGGGTSSGGTSDTGVTKPIVVANLGGGSPTYRGLEADDVNGDNPVFLYDKTFNANLGGWRMGLRTSSESPGAQSGTFTWLLNADKNGDVSSLRDFSLGRDLYVPASGSVYFGGDVRLYRSAADVLRTPDNLILDGYLAVGATDPVGHRLYVAGTGRFTGALQLDVQATATNHAVAASRAINAGTGLSGGGNLTADRTIALTGQALAIHNLATTGIVVRTGAAAFATRSIVGTANQVNVANEDGVSGNITLSLPQNIHTGASPTFAGLTLSSLTSGSVLFAGTGGAISQDNTNLFWDNTGKAFFANRIKPPSARSLHYGVGNTTNPSLDVDITFAAFLEQGSLLAYKTPLSAEYWDGTAWVTWTNPPEWKFLTDQQGIDDVVVDDVHKQFRLVYDLGAQFTLPTFLRIRQSYIERAYTVQVEADTSSAFTAPVTVIPTTSMNNAAWGVLFFTTSVADKRYVRITINASISTGQTFEFTGLDIITVRPGDQGRAGLWTFMPFSWDKDRNITLPASLAINGGSITSSATTFNLVNSTVTTLNIAGAATSITFGATTGTATFRNANNTFSGTGIHQFAGVIESTVAGTFLRVSSAVSSRKILFQTSGSNRWGIIGANSTAESGANAGSNFDIERYDDTGALIENALSITRSSGLVSITRSLTAGGNVTLSAASAILSFSSTTGVKQITTGGSTHLALMPGGNVGIGTTSPEYPLEISRTGTTRAQMSLYSAGDVPNDLFFGSNGQKQRWSISSRESTDGNGYPLTIWRNYGGWSRVMTIDYTTGNVGIGTTSPNYKLDVSGSGRFTGLTYFDGPESINLYGIRGRFSNQYIHLYNKVGIGDPSGWGSGEAITPNYGLSVYGGAVLATNQGNVGIGTTNPGTYRLYVNGTAFFADTLTEADSKMIRSATAPGAFASGFSIDYNASVTSQSTLYIDNIVARGSLRVHLFEKDVIRVINGKVMITDGTVLKADFTIPAVDQTTTIQVKDPVFVENDIIEINEYSEKNGSMTLMKILLYAASTGVTGNTSFQVTVKSIGVGVAGDVIKVGATVVRKGNTTNTSRQGHILLDSSSSAIPRIDIHSGVNVWNYSGAPVIRLGQLDSSTQFGLQGRVSGTEVFRIDNNSAMLAGWNFSSTALVSPNLLVALESNNRRLYVTDNVDVQERTIEVIVGKTDPFSESYGIRATEYTSDDYFRLDNSVRQIAGWNFDAYKFYKTISGVTTFLDNQGGGSFAGLRVNDGTMDRIKVGMNAGTPATPSATTKETDDFSSSTGWTLTNSGFIQVAITAGELKFSTISGGTNQTAYARKSFTYSNYTNKRVRVEFKVKRGGTYGTPNQNDNVILRVYFCRGSETNTPNSFQQLGRTTVPIISEGSFQIGTTYVVKSFGAVLPEWMHNNNVFVLFELTVESLAGGGLDVLVDDLALQAYETTNIFLDQTNGLRIVNNPTDLIQLGSSLKISNPFVELQELRLGGEWVVRKREDNLGLGFYYNGVLKKTLGTDGSWV